MTSGIIEILTDDATVQLLVGLNKKGDRFKVYPTVCPQPEDNPYIVVSKSGINTSNSICKDDASLLDYPQYTIISYAKNFRRSEELGEAVRMALDNKMSITEVCEFRRIWLTSEHEAWNNDLEMHAHVQSFEAEQVRPILPP